MTFFYVLTIKTNNNMKKIFGYLNLALFAATTLFITSCGDDEPIVNATAPSITESHDFAATMEPGDTITLKISGVKGSSSLKTIAVAENDAPLGVDRFTFGGANQVSSTFLLGGADTSGFSEKVLSIKLPAAAGSYKYSVTLTDSKSKTDKISVDVTTVALEDISSDTLYNSLGPLQGGLEFFGGTHVWKGSDANNPWKGAHIVDNGNSGDASNHPWKGEIIRHENTVLRKPATNVTFADVINSKQIKALHAAGTDIETLKLTPGGVFTAERDGIYYLVKVTDAQDDGKNSGDNSNLDWSKYEIKHKK